MISIMIAEDHDDLRSALRYIVDGEPDLECLGAVASSEQLLGEVQRLQPQVLVLDLLLDGGSSLQALRALTLAAPQMRIILYSGYISPAVRREAQLRGACACLSKGGMFGELLDEIRRQGASLQRTG